MRYKIEIEIEIEVEVERIRLRRFSMLMGRVIRAELLAASF